MPVEAAVKIKAEGELLKDLKNCKYMPVEAAGS